MKNKCKKCGRFVQNNKKYCSKICSPSTVDKFSCFRKHLSNANTRARKKKLKVNINLSDLEKQWNKQGGICPYTGWILKQTTSESKQINQASLDRINSKKGYIKGNIVWVCLMAQNAKNIHTMEDLIKFCKAVYEKHK